MTMYDEEHEDELLDQQAYIENIEKSASLLAARIEELEEENEYASGLLEKSQQDFMDLCAVVERATTFAQKAITEARRMYANPFDDEPEYLQINAALLIAALEKVERTLVNERGD